MNRKHSVDEYLENNFQLPEEIMALAHCCVENKDGKHWLHVDDAARLLLVAANHGVSEG